MKKILLLIFLGVTYLLNVTASEKLKLINLRDGGDNNIFLKDIIDSTKTFCPPMLVVNYGHTEVFFQNKLVESFGWWHDVSPAQFKATVYWGMVSPKIYVLIGVSVPQEGAKGIYVIENNKISLVPIVSSVCWREGNSGNDLIEKIDTVKYFSTYSIHEARVDTSTREILIKYDRNFKQKRFYRNMVRATIKY